MSANVKAQPPLFTSFWRSQLAAIVATLIDFSTLIFCVEVLAIWYGAAVAIAAALGAVVNFILGRYWSFQAHTQPVQGQALRYAIVAAGSLALNFFGVLGLTESLHIKYWVSKVIVATLVAILFNFTLQRFFVFSTDNLIPRKL